MLKMEYYYYICIKIRQQMKKRISNIHIMKNVTFLFMLGIAMLGTSCGGKKTQGVTIEDSTRIEKQDTLSNDTTYCGTYKGTLPAADCPGVKTVLTLRTDSTYDLSSDYIDKKDGQFMTSGIYHKRGQVIELVTPSSGDRTYYKIKDSKSVIMTDSIGNEPEGEMAKLYVLTKNGK